MTKHSVKQFAEKELEKYISLLGVDVSLRLGLFEDFGLESGVDDDFFDDAILISVKNKKGYIAGSNERSILIGVYRLLSEWGITFVRPGKNGTVIPKECNANDVEIYEKAAKRFRTMCIEGAISIENALDMIEWMPKVGFNSYFIQFSLPHVFFDRWYSHQDNPYKKPEPYSEEKTKEYNRIMIEEIKKRGLLVQTMGHGWTCFPFGISANGWYENEAFPKEYENICALVGGKRRVWNNTPLFTQLCYSDAYVKNTIVNAVADYIDKNPEADIVHFWLGDYFNNTCECPDCIKGRYSDHYIRMVNMITDMLTAKGLKTKIIFIVAYNTSHPPMLEKVRNTKNVICLFAPICRNYFTAFPNGYKIKEIPEYKTNNFSHRECNSVDKNLAFLHEWQKEYDGDCVDFDYHLMWDHILDAGGEGISRIIHQDMQNLSSLGINGFISCQLQRNAFPSSLAMTVMAKTLWNDKADFEAIRRKLYSETFGEEAVELICNYFSTLSDAFDVGIIRKHKEFDSEIFKTKLENAIELMESFGDEIEKHSDAENECHKKSWEYLKHHRNAYILVGRQILSLLANDKKLAEKYCTQATEYIMKNEDAVQEVLDTMFFARMIKEHITVIEESTFVGV